jgi:membrane protein
MVLSVGFLLLVSLIISAVLAAISGILGGFLTIDAATAYALDLAFSFAFNRLLFAPIYKFVPDVRIEWRDVWMGAAVTSLLFSAGKFLIAFYLGHSTATSIYGAAGSVVTLLLWIYYSSLMFFFGAKLTQVYASRYGSKAISVDCRQSADTNANVRWLGARGIHRRLLTRVLGCPRNTDGGDRRHSKMDQ